MAYTGANKQELSEKQVLIIYLGEGFSYEKGAVSYDPKTLLKNPKEFLALLKERQESITKQNNSQQADEQKKIQELLAKLSADCTCIQKIISDAENAVPPQSDTYIRDEILKNTTFFQELTKHQLPQSSETENQSGEKPKPLHERKNSLIVTGILKGVVPEANTQTLSDGRNSLKKSVIIHNPPATTNTGTFQKPALKPVNSQDKTVATSTQQSQMPASSTQPANPEINAKTEEEPAAPNQIQAQNTEPSSEIGKKSDVNQDPIATSSSPVQKSNSPETMQPVVLTMIQEKSTTPKVAEDESCCCCCSCFFSTPKDNTEKTPLISDSASPKN